jgi:hypothetical protein
MPFPQPVDEPLSMFDYVLFWALATLQVVAGLLSIAA